MTPLLRFPQFRDGLAWNVEPMETLYAFRRTNSLSRAQLNSLSGAVKNVHYGDIHTKYPSSLDLATVDVPYINGTEALPEPSSGDYCVEGDLIFADASEDTKDVGKCVEVVRLHGQRLLSGQHTILARRKQPSPIVGFGGHLFQSRQIRSQMEREAQGTKVYSISPTRLASIEIAYPGDIGEQEKITDCLASLEAVIAAQGRKVEALKSYKRGMIQQLFPREGESKPRLRFAEFRDAPGWRPEKAGALFTNRSERGIHTLPVYSVTMTDGLVSRASLDRRVDDLADATANKRAYERDIVYNTMRMWQGACGVANTDCMLSPAYVVLAPKGEVHSPFFGYLFKQPHMLRLFTAHSRGLTEDRLRLYFDDFCDVPVQLPSFNEQRRIADCLTTFDRTIHTEVSRLNELNAHKRALMYQLFPSAEAV